MRSHYLCFLVRYMNIYIDCSLLKKIKRDLYFISYNSHKYIANNLRVFLDTVFKIVNDVIVIIVLLSYFLV